MSVKNGTKKDLFADMGSGARIERYDDPRHGGVVAPYNRRSLKRPTRESVLKRLSEALMRRSLTKIDLSQRGLMASDAKLVKMALLQNEQLSVLKLGYNQLGDEGVKALTPGIASHKSLQSLDLGFNQVGDEGCKALAHALLSSSCCLRTLYLAGNHLGEESALALSDAIRKKKCTLVRLHLTGNRLGPDGVKAMTEAILEDEQRSGEERIRQRQQPSGIQELFLGGTSMGAVGCRSVAKMMSKSCSIRILSLANCGISDDEVTLLSSSIKENRDALPLESLQLSFNALTSKGTDILTSAIWGSKVLKELCLDNNEIGDRGAQHVANILPYIKTLEVLDVGFNSIKSHGMKALMKVVAETNHLMSLSVSGNPIDTGSAKAVAYALAYNRSLKYLYLDHCDIQHEGQRHIVAGFVSNSGIALRKLTGFRIGPVIVTIEMPGALEHWTNEQVLNFIHLMWEQQSNQYACEPQSVEEVDPLQFLPDAPVASPSLKGPLDATTVVEVAKRAFASLGESGHDVFSKRATANHALNSPLMEDAIMIESGMNGSQVPVLSEDGSDEDAEGMPGPRKPPNGANGKLPESVPEKPKSFVAAPAEPAKSGVSDPERKKRIVDWLCQNIQHLNELSQLPFNSGELGRLHQHYFTPVVNERGGSAPVGASPLPSTETVGRIVNSVPEVSRVTATDSSTITPSTNSSGEQMMVPMSDPAFSPPPQGMPMLKRKVSYRFLGDAMLNHKTDPTEHHRSNGEHAVARMIEDGAGVQAMPPKTKRARRNKTRISFLPRIKDKLESYLDVCHEKALILMRQLRFVERSLLEGRINPSDSTHPKPTHLSGIRAEEAEMILIDMV